MDGLDTSRRVDPERTHWLQLGLVCAANFVVWSGFGAILPLLPLFLKDEAHASVSLIGVAAAAYYLGALMFSAPLGRLSDSVGRKPVIVGGVTLYAVATLLFLSTTQPLWFVFFRFVEGVGAGAVGPAGQALVADLSTEKTRSRAYGWFTTAQFGGLVAGPGLAAILYRLVGGEGLWSFYAIFLFGGVASAITAVVLWFALREPEHTSSLREVSAHRAPYRSLITRPVGAFLIVAVTGHFAMGVWEVLWSLWLDRLGASPGFISMTWVAFSAPMVLSFVGGYLADRYSRWSLMFSGYALAAVAWVLYGTTTSLTLFIVFNVMEGFAVAWSYPAKQAFLVQVVPSRWLGTVQGLEGTATQVAALVGTVTAPFLYTKLHGFVISIAGFVSLLGLFYAGPVLLKVWRQQKKSRI